MTAASGRIATGWGSTGAPCMQRRSQDDEMDKSPSVDELKKRWETVLAVTDKAVSQHPMVYREIKSLTVEIITKPLDIKDYPMTAERLVRLLKAIGCNTQGSIFQFYYDRFSPSSIWHLKLFRAECEDLLAYLSAFDEWRRKIHRLRLLK